MSNKRRRYKAKRRRRVAIMVGRYVVPASRALVDRVLAEQARLQARLFAVDWGSGPNWTGSRSAEVGLHG